MKDKMKNKVLNLVMLLAVASVVTWGCATISPGADPFVVRVEQTQTAAAATFDMILHIDQADRGFWRTNAPGFHQFCEWLRTPQLYGTNSVSRAVLMQVNVDDLKLAYKAGKTTGSSNALQSAWSVLTTAISQSTSWSNIVTSVTHP